MIENSASTNRTLLLQYYVTWLLALLALTGLVELFLGNEIDRPINLHHWFACLGLGVFMAYGRVMMPPWTINIFFMTLLGISAIAAIEHGLHPMLLNSAYCFYLCLLGLLCGSLLSKKSLLTALRTSAWIILAAITIKNIFYIHDIIDALSALQGRLFIPTVIAGGINVEATFALFAAVFLRGSRGYWLAFGYAFLMAILYSSRAAILGSALLFAYEVLSPTPNASPLRKQFRITGLIIGAFAITILLFSSPITQFALSRFENIGYEPGSEGRLAMWQAAPQVFTDYPFGVGAGNSIHEIENVLGHDIQEDNLHNIYLQILLDLGILGLASYILMIYTAAQRGFANDARNPLWLAIGLYFLMGILQFRAYDPFMFFWLGLAWHEKRDDA